MHNRSKLVFAALAATLLMAFAASSASAGRFSLSNQAFRAVWNPLTLTDNSGNPVVECPVTLEGSFHSQTIVKVIRSLVGYVSRAISAATEPPCSGGTATVLPESLPWHITYEGFTGRLPNIERIRLLLRGIAFRVFVFGVNCLYRDEGEGAAGEVVRTAANELLSIAADPAIRIKKRSGIVLCPAFGGFLGTSNPITLLGSSTKITITLI